MRDGDARAVPRSAARFKLEQQVVDRIIAEPAATPLALPELPRALSAPEPVGSGTGTLSASPTRIEGASAVASMDLPSDAAAPTDRRCRCIFQ